MAHNAIALAGRFEGRLFSEEGRLYFVIDVDAESGFARVSCQVDGERQLLQMPIADVGLKLSSSAKLEGFTAATPTNRIVQQADGWFFSTREGLQGPYLSDTDAERGLNRFIESMQQSSEPRVAAQG